MKKPNFLIAGGSKGGSTALGEYVKQHPRLFIHNNPELHYFDEMNMTLEKYQSFFIYYADTDVVGERTPSYQYDKNAPKNAYNFNPDFKLIFILRNPVDRAHSHYWHNVRLGAEDRSFKEAIDHEKKELDRSNAFTYGRVGKYSKTDEKKDGIYRYLGIGKYSVHFKRWLKYFDKDQIHVLLLEELSPGSMDQICKFLGVEPFGFDLTKKHNVGKVPRSRALTDLFYKRFGHIPVVSTWLNNHFNLKKGGYASMSPNMRADLLKYFKKYNQDLSKMFGLDLGAWDK